MPSSSRCIFIPGFDRLVEACLEDLDEDLVVDELVKLLVGGMPGRHAGIFHRVVLFWGRIFPTKDPRAWRTFAWEITT